MADTNRGYWSRSWALLTMHDGWIKPVLALAAARLVPIVGPFGADGYALEWGRLTAWGVDAAPKQKGVDIGACIVSGARAFVVALGYGIVLALINGVASSVFGELLGGLLVAIMGAFSIILVLVAKLRTTVYQSVGAGYQVNRIADMIKRDTSGFARLVGLSAAIYAVLGIAGSIVITLALVVHAGPLVAQLIELDSADYVSEARMVRMVFTMLAGMLPTLCVLGFLFSVVNTVASLILTTATGLWMRQFDVQHWGQSADPLPGTAPAATATAAAPEYPQNGTYGGGTYGAEPTPTGWATPTASPTASTEPEATPAPTTWTGPTAQSPAEPVVPLWPVESAPQPEAPTDEVPGFSLDEFAAVATPEPAIVPQAATEPVVESEAMAVPQFELETVASTPEPEPYQGPVESDDDARKALASLDLPVRPFDHVVETAAPMPADDADGDVRVVEVVDLTESAVATDSEPEGAPEFKATDAGGVPTFTLDDLADSEASSEANE